ncbi:MAG: hypothetical protein L0G18_18605, partial [Pseudomonas sp.]|nr:hypothetical protein [Pseudomonas sp.]
DQKQIKIKSGSLRIVVTVRSYRCDGGVSVNAFWLAHSHQEHAPSQTLSVLRAQIKNHFYE